MTLEIAHPVGYDLILMPTSMRLSSAHERGGGVKSEWDHASGFLGCGWMRVKGGGKYRDGGGWVGGGQGCSVGGVTVGVRVGVGVG